MESPEHENYYDNKFYIFEELKMEVPDTEVPHSDCNVNNEIVSEDKELSKFNDQMEKKHEAMVNRLPLNITLSSITERIVEREILGNKQDISVPYKLNAQKVQLNSDEKLLKHNVNTLRPNNEQTNNARAVELDKFRMPANLYSRKLSRECEIKDTEKNGFQCDSCQKIFKMKYYLVSHIKRYHYDYGRTFDCCGKQFRSPVHLREHKRRQHKHKHKIKGTDNDIFQCDSCQKIFKNKQYLVLHITMSHYDYGERFECWCGKRFRAPLHLYNHKQCHKREPDNNGFRCDRCQKTFKLKRFLVAHVKRVHYDYGRAFNCWCGKRFRSPMNLYAHKQHQHKRKIKDTGNGSVQCDSCQRIFKKKQTLVTHIRKFHYEYERTFGCWCGIQCRSPVHLREHKLWWHVRKVIDAKKYRFQCESCQKVFKEKRSLFIHVKRFHYDHERSTHS